MEIVKLSIYMSIMDHVMIPIIYIALPYKDTVPIVTLLFQNP